MATEGGNGATASPQRGRPAVPDDLRAQVRQRKKDQSRLDWWPVTRFIFRLMARHPFMVGGILVWTLLLAAMEIANAALLAPFLNMLMGGEVGVLRESPLGILIPIFESLPIATQIRWYALIFFGITLVKAVFLYGLTRLAQYLHIVINRDLRTQLFEDILAVEMRWVNKQRSSNLFTLIHSFPGSASKIVDQYLMGFQNFTSFLALVLTLALISVPLLLLSAAIGLVVTLIAVQLTGIVRRFAYAVTESKLRLHNVTLEALTALKVLHLFGRTGHTKKKYGRELREFQRNQFKQASVKALVSPVQTILAAAFVGSVLLGATILYDLESGGYLATIILFMSVVTKFQSRSSKYAKRRAEIAAEVPAMEEVINHIERKDKRYIRDGTKPFKGLTEGIRFEDVRFRYEADEAEVIKGVSFDIPRGHMVALVGGSGAGKSTLIDLLARIYDPDAGRIVVDGQDLRTLRMKDWRGRVSVVSQDSFLFNDSVRENIRFGRLDATDEEVEMAAQQANADRFIAELPQGYDTTLGDRGVRLSGGQRQRIAIARAILADPDVLILDEATSALDTETEAQVQAAIDEVAKDRTIIAIAHRLSTVRKADRIVVLEDGLVVESGKHSELLAARGRYWEYVQLQDLGRRDPDRPEGLAPDGRVAWLEVTLQKDASSVAGRIAALEGVRAVRSQGRRLDIVVEAPSRTIPALFRVFAESRLRVDVLELDDLPMEQDGQVYRWSGNGAGRAAEDPVWIEFFMAGDAGLLVEAFEAHRNVRAVVAAGPRLGVLLQYPGTTVPDLVHEAAERRLELLSIDPQDIEDDDLVFVFDE